MSDDADRLSKMTLEELRLELHRVRSKPDSELRRIADLFRVNVNKQLPYEEELLSLIEFHEKQEAQNLRTTELSSMEALVLVDMVIVVIEYITNHHQVRQFFLRICIRIH